MKGNDDSDHRATPVPERQVRPRRSPMSWPYVVRVAYFAAIWTAVSLGLHLVWSPEEDRGVGYYAFSGLFFGIVMAWIMPKVVRPRGAE